MYSICHFVTFTGERDEEEISPKIHVKKFHSSLVYTMLVIMLVVLQMVSQEQLATFVHVSKNYAS